MCAIKKIRLVELSAFDNDKTRGFGYWDNLYHCTTDPAATNTATMTTKTIFVTATATMTIASITTSSTANTPTEKLHLLSCYDVIC